MDDKVDVVPLVEVVDKVYSFVIPSLGIAHGDEADDRLAFTLGFYLCDIMLVDICRTTDACVVWMIVYHVATAYA